MEKNVLNTDLTGKVAVVTGAGGVLCSAFAKVLARAGAKVALLDLNEEAAQQFAGEITAEGGVAKAYKCNVLDKDMCCAVASQVLEDLGPCDVLINGAGAESFLDQVVAQLPELPIVDASAGIELLPAGHEHDHGGEPEDEEEHAFYNEHIWASPQRYRRQVENLRDGLMRLDPAHAAAYEANAAAYLARVSEVEDRLRRAVEAAPTKICITFHDSLQYFARDLGLTPAAALTIGEEAGVSAADLAAAQQAATAAGKVLLLYDSQYPVEYAYVGEGASWCRTLDLDMGVAGEADKDAWLRAMEGNARALEAAFA